MSSPCLRREDGSLSSMHVIYDYQVFSNNGKSGISRYFVELASHLRQLFKIELEVVVPISRSPFLSEKHSHLTTFSIDFAGVPLAAAIPDRLVRLLNEILFREYARRKRPDIVHETFYAASRSAPRTAKIVSTVHDSIPERNPELYPNANHHHLERQKVISRADWLICVSESTRSDLLELYDVDPKKVSVVRLASSLAKSKDGPINIGMPYFLHVGNRYPHKNFDGILRAFAEAKLYRTHKLVSFTDKGWNEEELKLMGKVGVPESAVMTVGGSDALLARFYAGAEALVFPSLYEGFGIPLLEAMRVGCPIITSNVSSMPEVAGDAAVYVDPKSSSSIAHGLMRVASSLETRSSLITNGITQAQKFSWEKCALETHEVYEQVLAETSRAKR